MRDISRRDFLKYSAAAVAAPSFLDLMPTKAFGATPKLAPALDLKTLVAKSKAEGGTCLFYAGSSDLALAVQNGFHTAYPWATLNTQVSSTGDIRNKVLTETLAGGPGADVFSCAPATPYVFIRANACQPVALVSDANLLPTLKDPTGYRHPYAQNVQVLVSNPSLASYVPTDIYQLSTPAFKGQIAFDAPDNLASAALFLASHRKAWGDKKWMTWLQGLKSNNIFITSSATSSYQAVLTGERGIGIDNIGDVLSQAAGAPVKANFYQGMPPYIQSLMMTTYTKKPYTSQLFMNWVLSKTGQEVIVSTSRTPTMDIPGAATATSTLVPKGANQIAPASSIAGFVYNPAPYLKIFDSLWPS